MESYMGIILPLLSFFLFVFFLAFIANAITKLLFPRQKGTALEYLFTGFLFSVEIVALTWPLCSVSVSEEEAGQFFYGIYILLGMPITLIGIFLLSYFKSNNNAVSISVLMACMTINISIVVFLIKSIIKNFNKTPPHE